MATIPDPLDQLSEWEKNNLPPTEIAQVARPDGITGWLSYIADLFINFTTAIPRLIWALVKSVAFIFWFVIFNLQYINSYIDRLPDYIASALSYIQALINIGPAVMSWNMPGWAISYLQFLNSILPLTEVFRGMSSIAGLTVLCFLIRVIFKLSIIFR